MSFDKAKLKGAIAGVRKAIVGTLTVVVLGWLHKAGVEIPNDALSLILDAAIAGGIVYLVPNADEYLEVHVEAPHDAAVVVITKEDKNVEA